MTIFFWAAAFTIAAAIAELDWSFIPRLINDTLILWEVD